MDRMAGRERVADYRRRMRERGLRPVQIWVPDVRSEAFALDARRQADVLSSSAHEADEQAFVEAASAPWDDE